MSRLARPYSTVLMMSKMGRYIATTIPPTIAPRNTIMIGSMTEVSAPTVEILTDFLTLIGKQDALAQMQANGTLQQTADWLDTQFATFNDLLGQATALFADAWNAIAPENLPNLIDNLSSLAQRAWSLLQAVGAFAWTVIGQVLALIKNALLGLLSEHAHKLPGFHLLTVILGKNPFTGAEVEGHDLIVTGVRRGWVDRLFRRPTALAVAHTD